MAATGGLPGSRKQAVRGGHAARTQAGARAGGRAGRAAGGLEPDVPGASPQTGAAGETGSGHGASGCGGPGARGRG